jgi:hypothetical protein
MTGAGLPHSETPGSTLGCQLPGAYRRLPRPSSAPDAKASTVCPKKLEHNKKNKMLAFTMQFSKHERTPTPTNPPDQPHTPHQKQGTQNRGMRTGPARPLKTPPPTRQTRVRSGLKTQTNSPPHQRGRLSCPFPQDPTVCSAGRDRYAMVFLNPEGQYSHPDQPRPDRVASAPPMSGPTRRAFACGMSHGPCPST